ncbi:pyrroline-5-carboxylate reductase [Lichenihabitans sp. Uapishka_5]|uniref:pyrroline-5-carboxylate reductase n=1 Tax=Lichenihabitans sp. Uapishka_5 TaxID=3037302 RepID=UPI0029E8127F|nr:pyrroline-5-carboxylate reductase [Lichenihabitans sp. Uapishka_5]MDX7950711.1 pyrroline-5-carboxylate reductase [Lichenihabitans sp. Uapishka_5]
MIGSLLADLDGPVVLVGAGHMGGALLAGWLDSGAPADRIVVVDPGIGETRAAELTAHGVRLNARDVGPAGLLVLAIKPQQVDAAALALRPFVGPNTILVSVVAGRTIADLRQSLPGAALVVRAMPNTPAAIRQGITGVAAEAHADVRQRAVVQALLEAVGRVEWLPREDLIDAVTAVSGSGPAYVFLLAECLAEAGVAAGLDAPTAARLARATVEGAAALMAARPESEPELLRRNVTSPGGTTAAALAVLTGEAGLHPLMERAVAAAKQRATALSR